MFRYSCDVLGYTSFRTEPIRFPRKAIFPGAIRYKTIEYIRGCSNFFKTQQLERLAVSRVGRFCTSKGSISSSEKLFSRLLGVSSCFVIAVVTANAEGHGSDKEADLSVGAQPTIIPDNTPALAAANIDSTPQHLAIDPVTQVLSFTPDLYSGLSINSSDLPTSPLEFQQRLAASLEAWKAEGKRGIWLTIPSDLVDLVPVAVKMG
jgi:hypothetical protein